MDKQARIAELEKDIKFYQDDYYKGGQLISDAEFDDMWDELKTLDPGNPILGKIGSDLDDDEEPELDGFLKAKHVIPMGSQQKAANPEAFIKWGSNHKYPEYLVQYKLDGASLELQYLNGLFTRAVTRGDGTIGDDITVNVSKMKGIVKKLKDSFTGGIRGEVLMSHSVHKDLYSDKANCRNAATGVMKRKDGTGSENLHVIVYDATSNDGNIFSSEEEKINWLKEMGFETVTTVIVNSIQDVIDYRAHAMSIRDTLPMDIDGLVIKNNDIDQNDLARARPDKQIAFKFSLDEAVTILKSVFWSESGATYTPLGIVEAVQLNGTTVQRANLCNPNMIKKMNLKIGSKIIITKRGEIIPKIESLVENPPGTTEIEIPTKCSACGTQLINDGTRLYCPNSGCSKKGIHQITKWIKTLDIKELGTSLIEKLYAEGLVTSIYSLYTLKASDIAVLDRMGERSAEKVIKNRDALRTVSLAQFVAGFDIEDIGRSLIAKLEKAGFDTLDKLLSARVSQIAEVQQFNTKTAEKLVSGLTDNKDEMIKLAKDFITIDSVKDAPVKGGKLEGKSFCFTGTLDSMKRSEAEQKVVDAGGTISAVKKGLSYLVTNDTSSGSSKNKKASELGIDIIDEQQFLSLL